MMIQKENQKKSEYERIVKIVKEAEKEAEKYIKKNTSINNPSQAKYL